MNKMLIFYDADCPLCCSKRDFLQRLDHQILLIFIDIRTADSQTLKNLPSIELLAFEIHSITPDGRILRGMEVIREAYHMIGLGWVLAPTGWPFFRSLFDCLYTHVAKNRLRYSKVVKFSKH